MGSMFKKACFSHVVVMTLQQRSSLNALIDKKKALMGVSTFVD